MSIDRAKALQAAQKHLAKGHLDRAISEFEKVVQADPSDARSQLKLGDLYVKKGDNAAGSRTYRKVADQYAAQGFFLKAVAVFKQILKLDPQNLETHEQLGEMYRQLSLTSDALATFEQVVQGYTRAGQPNRAMKALGHIADLDPENVAARIKHAEALSKADRIDEAVASFQKGADTLKRQGRLDDFIKVTERLLYHDHDIPRARELASLYLERSDPKHALAHLQVCFKSDPKDTATLELLAQAFQQLGQVPKAVSVYKEMAAVHAAQGQRTDQEFALQAILQLSPDDAEVRRQLTELQALEDGSDVEMLDDDDDLIMVDDEELDEDEELQEGLPELASPALPAPELAPAASMPPGGEPMLGSLPPGVDPRQAQIDRLLSECDVFIRYGLGDKVVAQLDKVLDLDPMNVEARQRLKAHHLKEGSVDEAVTQLIMLADAVNESDPERARSFLEEAAQLAPDNAAVSALLERMGATAPVADYGFDEEDEDEEDEEDDLVILDDEEEEEAEGEPALADAYGDEDEEDEDLGPTDDDEPDMVLEQADDEPDMVLEQAEEEAEEIVLEADVDSVPPVAAGPAASVLPRGSFAPAPPAPAAPAPAPVAAAPPSTAVAPPDPGDVPEEIAEALEEVDFYLSQDMKDEARDAVVDALEEHPDHPVLIAKLAEIDGEPPPAQAEDQSFALAQKLAQESAPAAQGGPMAMDEVLHQFKEGVKNQVDKGDTATHYDLGIAYMEMGLHAEAIEAFRLCLANADRACTANTMIGLSYVSKGEMESGITHFKLALQAPIISETERLDLWFEIGNAYELQSDGAQALTWYQRVLEQNPEFRDVTLRIERIGQPKSDDEEADEFDQMFDDMILKE